jgi:hypothetical protein
MDDDEKVSTFCSLTGATHEQARGVLEAHDGDLERSVDFYFAHGAGGGAADHAAAAAPPQQAQEREVIQVRHVSREREQLACEDAVPCPHRSLACSTPT